MSPNAVRRAGTALLVPRVAWLSHRALKQTNAGWDRYWSRVRTTGERGDVLWDSGGDREQLSYLEIMRGQVDETLTVIDIGCGNGRFTRWLADRFPCALGLDLSPAAIARAKLESLDVPNVDFRALDATTSAVGRDLLSELGECNVFVRGVFHVLGRAAQLSLAENLGPLVGVRGRLFLAETNFPGSQLAYLAHLGATPWRIPAPLERAIADLPKPGHFGHCELRGCFPEAEWKIITAGETTIETVPMRGGTDPELIPGYYALLAHHGRAD